MNGDKLGGFQMALDVVEQEVAALQRIAEKLERLGIPLGPIEHALTGQLLIVEELRKAQLVLRSPR
jgi:hypothetical protein